MFVLIIILCVCADQVSKFYISTNMEVGESIDIIGDFLQFTYHLNTGAGFSMLEGQRWLFVLLTVIVLVVVLILNAGIDPKFKRLHMLIAVFCGGTIGNFIDRVLHGAVVDFIDFSVFPAIFNIADSCLTVSVIAICVLMLFGPEKVLMENKKRQTHGVDDMLAEMAKTAAVRPYAYPRYYRRYGKNYGHKNMRTLRYARDAKKMGVIVRYQKKK